MGVDAVSPGTLVRLAEAGPHPLTRHCTACGACEVVCPHQVAIRERLLPQADPTMVPGPWAGLEPLVAETVVLSGCTTHHDAWPPALLRAALAEVAPEARVLPALPCGGPVASPAMPAARAMAIATAGCQTLVVPTGACRDAIGAHLEAAGRRGAQVAVFDQWLARFGVALPRGAQRFACCRLRRVTDTDDDGAARACCGAGEPLRSAYPASARATAAALLAQWREAGWTDVVVEDASCHAHLAQVAREVGAPLRLFSRASAFLSQGERR